MKTVSEKIKKQVEKCSRREFLKQVTKGAAGIAATGGALTALTGCSNPGESPIHTPCYPNYVPSPTVTHETVLGQADGSIQNYYEYPVEISPSPNFSSGNFILASNSNSQGLPAGNYYARWAATADCKADTKVKDITIEKGKELPPPPPPPLDIGSVESNTVGSDQEWALSSLAKLPNSAQLIAFYNYLVKAHTYLMLHDKESYPDIYNESKKSVEDWLANPPSDATPLVLEIAKQELKDDNWIIRIRYPLLDKSFNLNQDEIRLVHSYLSNANPQFFLGRYVPYVSDSADSRYVSFSMPAYYLSADNRQKSHKKILDGFERFESEFKKSGIDTNNRYDVVKYVYDDIIKNLDYANDLGSYVPREISESLHTILGYFGDIKRTMCEGYLQSPQYLLNRLGIRTIHQEGVLLGRDLNGNLTGKDDPHGWYLTQMENGQWYATDATGKKPDNPARYTTFLKGQTNTGNPVDDFFWLRAISKDMIYPEVAINDYPHPRPLAQSIQTPARERQPAAVPVM